MIFSFVQLFIYAFGKLHILIENEDHYETWQSQKNKSNISSTHQLHVVEKVEKPILQAFEIYKQRKEHHEQLKEQTKINELNTLLDQDFDTIDEFRTECLLNDWVKEKDK